MDALSLVLSNKPKLRLVPVDANPGSRLLLVKERIFSPGNLFCVCGGNGLEIKFHPRIRRSHSHALRISHIFTACVRTT
jgi:hypothetical protein